MKIKSKEDKITKITSKELNWFLDDISFTYCTECTNDGSHDCNDCIVMKVNDLLREHLKEECKEQIKGGPIDRSCEGCIHEHECSLTE